MKEMVGSWEADFVEMGGAVLGSGADRSPGKEVKMTKMQCVAVPVPQGDCNYYASQTYANLKRW